MKRYYAFVAFVVTWSIATVAVAATGEGDLNVDNVLTLAKDKKWPALFAVLLYGAVRLVKDDNKFPISIPAKYRIWLVWLLGIGSCIADKAVEGVPLKQAVENMAITLVIAVVLFHETFIQSIREGKELPLPGLMIPGAKPSPAAPPTVPETETQAPKPPNASS